MHKTALPRWCTPVRLAATAAFLLACCTYLGIVRHEFVRWDDGMLIYENPAIRGITPQTLLWVFTHFDPELYIPLTFISYQLNYLVGGIHPSVYLLTNVGLHGLNAALLTVIVALLTGRTRVALLCGLLFAVHPLHTEAVAWASGRKDLLSTAFFFGAWISFLRFQHSGAKRTYWLSVLLHLAGMLSKVMTATLPAVLILEACVFRPKEARQTLRQTIPHIALSAVLVTVAVFGKEHLVAVTTTMQKLLMACLSTAFYIRQMFWPVRLSLLYPYVGDISLSVPAIAWSVVAVAAMLLSVTVLRRRAAVWTFCVLGYVGTLAPTFLNFSKGGELDMYFASDRYAYIPSIFVFLGVAYGLDRLSGALENRRRLPYSPFAVTAAALVTVMTVLAWRQARVWQNTRTLFAHVIETYPSVSHVAHNNLGNMERLSGNMDAAVKEFQQAIAIRPNAKTWSNLGAVYRRQGKVADARDAYANALRLDPQSPDAHFGLGIIAAERGDRAAAVRAYEEALRYDPNMEEVWLNLGALHAGVGEFSAAAEAYGRALRINPFFLQAHHNLGVALQQTGDSQGAEAAFREAVRLQPSYTASRMNLGVLLAKRGDREGALAQFRAILAFDPANATAQSAVKQLTR